MRKLLLVITVVALLVGLAAIAVGGDDPFVGVWKWNAAKSKSVGPATLKSQTVTIELMENGIKITQDNVTSEGKTGKVVYASQYDGKDYPVTGAVNPGSTYALKKIDSNTVEGVFKENGKMLGSSRWVVSKDGKTMTGTSHQKDPNGKDATGTAVYDKQ